MKRILTVLLLLVFNTSQLTFAGDVIIIGSDGQARYEDERKNVLMTQVNIQDTKQKDILNEVTITDDSGKTENIYIDYKGNVKKVEEGQSYSTVNPIVDKTAETEYEKCVTEAPKFLYEIDSILYKYGYKKRDNSLKSQQEYMKMDLLDGDYVVGYKDVPYLAEYHSDGELMGLIKVDKRFLNKQRGFVIFYEYRVGYNTSVGMGLKHVLFLDFEKGKYITQYIYKYDGKLLCRQVNNDIYIADEARNMIPDWSKKREFNVIIQDNNKKTKINSKNINKVLSAVTSPIWAPIAFVGTGVIILGFIAMISICGIDHY